MEYVAATDGVRIAYEKRGAGDPLVLVHGTAANHTSWNYARPIFEDHFTVYAMDRRGRNESGDADDYAVEQEFDDIVTLIESIGEAVYLIGHSYGALSSLGASARTDAIRQMVLYEPPLWTEGHELAPEEPIATMEAHIEAGDNEAVIETFFSEVARADERLAYYRTLPTWKDRLDAAPTIPREVRGTGIYRPTVDEFADVDASTLVLLGDQTAGHLPDGTRRAHDLLPNSELRVLEGLDHSAIYSEPERFAEVALTFLSTE